jgi:hypothetical protein
VLRKQEPELVASEPRDRVRLSEDLAEPVAQLFQKLVAGVVAE